jgi:non-canonical poly(A) RNA polymerase PAPD5/7
MKLTCFGVVVNDISSGSFNFFKVRATLAGAHAILLSTAYLRAGIIESRLAGTNTRLRQGPPQSDEMSVLSSVLTITQEVTSFLPP